MELGKILIPKFPVPEKETEESYLVNLTFSGLAKRYLDLINKEIEEKTTKEIKNLLPKNVVERAEYELSVINKMGFNGYFLIIWVFIKWGKDNGIVFGPGRGSAAGSIVSYALSINDLNP